MTAEPGRARRPQPRWLLRGSWAIHRAVFRASGGRLGLREAEPERLGTLRLRTLGRHSGQERTSMLFYLEDGANLAVVASNAGASIEPAWLLNLRASTRGLRRLARRRPRRRWPGRDGRGAESLVGPLRGPAGRLYEVRRPSRSGPSRWSSWSRLNPTVGRVPVAELEVRAIVFDMDGVLIDSGDIYGRHWEHWAATAASTSSRSAGCTRVGRPQTPSGWWRRSWTRGPRPSVSTPRFVIEHAIDEVRAMPGAVELVAALPSGRWTIATSAQKATARARG